MSKLILDKLETFSPLIKAKGFTHEKYGVVKDGVLYFNNGIVEVSISIDLPFNTCIDLYQLHTVLKSLKGESVIVNKNDKVYVHHEDVDYNIETLPINSLDHIIKFFNATASVRCDKPTVFKEMCLVAQNYVQPITNQAHIDFLNSVMFVHNNTALFTDKYNVVQAQLDFGMPTLAFPFEVIYFFNKVSKKVSIVGMDIVDTDYLLVELSNGLKIYLPNMFTKYSEQVLHTFNRIEQALNKNWELPSVVIPDTIKTQIMLVNKISLQNVVFFTGSFCQANNSQINYPQFTQEDFNFKCLFKHLKMIFQYGKYFKIGERGLSFLSEDSQIRGYIGKMLND